jgi:hypothetical protein
LEEITKSILQVNLMEEIIFFRYNSQCIVLVSACRAGQSSTSTNNVAIDVWNNGAGAGAGDYGYFARFNLQTGSQENGQFQYTNAGVNAARSYAILPITADENGNVYQGGKAINGTIPNRTTLSINNNPVSNRINNETALIGVNSNFTQRTVTATWTPSSAADVGEIRAISAVGGIVAVLGNTNGNIVTSSPIQASFGGLTDAFFAVWGDSTSNNSSSSSSSQNSSSNSSSSLSSSQSSNQSLVYISKPKPVVFWTDNQSSSKAKNSSSVGKSIDNQNFSSNSKNQSTKRPDLSIYNNSKLFKGAFGSVEISGSY